MPSKNSKQKKISKLKNIKFLTPKNLNIVKLKINPANIVEDTKSKIGSYYTNFKKEWEKNKERKEIKKKLDEKKELEVQKKMQRKKNLTK